MKKTFFTFSLVFCFLLLTANVFAQAPCPDDSTDCNEPPVQTGENVAEFKKGPGGKPKNEKSVFAKGIKMHNPTLGGTGCPQGTVTTVLSPDNKTLSIFFDNYVAEAGSNKGIKRDIKACTAILPIEVPSGFQFSLVKLDYRGFNAIPAQGKTKYLTIYSILDEMNNPLGKRLRRQFVFKGPLEEDYIITSDVSANPSFSPCGKKVNFRIETRAVAVTNKNGDETIATIDSIDAKESIDYHLLWRECKSTTPTNPTPTNPNKPPGGGKPGKPPHGIGKKPHKQKEGPWGFIF